MGNKLSNHFYPDLDNILKEVDLISKDYVVGCSNKGARHLFVSPYYHNEGLGKTITYVARLRVHMEGKSL